MNLAENSCEPCKKGVPALGGAEIQTLSGNIKQWNVIDYHHITKHFKFNSFALTCEFVNQICRVAESENHHPDICFGWGKAEITIYTHAVDGLHENDFILAAKIDKIGSTIAQETGTSGVLSIRNHAKKKRQLSAANCLPSTSDLKSLKTPEINALG